MNIHDLQSSLISVKNRFSLPSSSHCKGKPLAHQIHTFLGFFITHWFVPATQTLSAYWIYCSLNSFSCFKYCLEAKTELLFTCPNSTIGGGLHCSSDLAELAEPYEHLSKLLQILQVAGKQAKAKVKRMEDIYRNHAHCVSSCQAQTSSYWLVVGSQKWMCWCRCQCVRSTRQAWMLS